jgi:hypothetical protein
VPGVARADPLWPEVAVIPVVLAAVLGSNLLDPPGLLARIGTPAFRPPFPSGGHLLGISPDGRRLYTCQSTYQHILGDRAEVVVVDAETGHTLTTYEVIPLHPVVVEYLKKIVGDGPLVFPWDHDPRTLWVEFTRIQQGAGIHLTCREKHDHTPSCHVYGFHDFRRAFATVNAPRLKPEVLQRLMRHKSYQTTQKFYINPTSQMQDAVSDMPLPDFLKKKPEGQTDGPEGSGGK